VFSTKHRWLGRLSGLAVAAVLSTAGTVGIVSTPAAHALDNGLAATPPMGFNDWNSFACNITAQDFRNMADLFVKTGLRDAGYNYINIDDCWMKGRDLPRSGTARAAAGRSTTAPYRLIPDPTYFPDVDLNGNGVIDPSEQGDGIQALADYVHSKGLKLGIYESAGTTTCQGLAGSLGYEQVDAQTYADWGIDYLKYDNCGAHSTTTLDGRTVSYPDTDAGYQARFTAMHTALASVARPILFSICEWGNASVWNWGPQVGNIWRTTVDISAAWTSIASIFEQNIKLSQYAAPGGWNDPDMLEVGNGTTLTPTENRSHFSLWAMMDAPLIIGSNLNTISSDALSVLLNKDVIAVDQDPLGVAAKVVSHVGSSWVLEKPMADGTTTVALFNEGPTATSISTTVDAVNATEPSHQLAKRGAYTLKDLWSGVTTQTTGTVASSVPAHGTVVYTVATAPGAAVQPPSVALDATSPASTLAPGESTVVTVSADNNGLTPIMGTKETLSAPAGWGVTQLSGPRGNGADVTMHQPSVSTFRVTAPSAAAAPISAAILTAGASYTDVRGSGSLSTTVGLSVVTPVTSYKTVNNTAGTATFGQLGQDLAISAAGAGVAPAVTSSFGAAPAADEFAAIYTAGAAGTSAVAQVTVTSRQGISSADKSGLMMRNSMGGGGTPVGVGLYVTGTNSVAMVYGTDGGTAYTAAYPSGGSGPGGGGSSTPAGAAVTLKLVRSGTTYTGYYSVNGGATFTRVGTAAVTVAAAAAAPTQDVGVFHTSGTASVPTLAQFTGLTVS
jgi:alpha-galactosidase